VAVGLGFPATHRSLVDRLHSDEASERQRSLSLLTRAYYAPIHTHLMSRWRLSSDEATELTQEFFATAVAKKYLETYDASKGRFRTFVRTCVDRLVSTSRRDARRLKRGGAAARVELEEADREIRDEGGSPEEAFDREWVRSVLALAVATLREECEERKRTNYFVVFERYDLDDSGADVSYASLAEELGVSAKDVANYLAAARRDFRRIVLDSLRQLTASDEEFREEARLLLGTDP
jgi:RNA polymerase sigma factor (sigma-70 family)